MVGVCDDKLLHVLNYRRAKEKDRERARAEAAWREAAERSAALLHKASHDIWRARLRPTATMAGPKVELSSSSVVSRDRKAAASASASTRRRSRKWSSGSRGSKDKTPTPTPPGTDYPLTEPMAEEDDEDDPQDQLHPEVCAKPRPAARQQPRSPTDP